MPVGDFALLAIHIECLLFFTNTVDSADTGLHEQPPSYESLFGKIKAAHETSDNKLSFAKTSWGLISTSVGFIVCLGITLCLPIAHVIIGSVFLHDCTIQRFIPIYLVVGGACALVQNLVGLVNKIKDRGQGNAAHHEERETPPAEKATNCFNSLFSCFMFAWFIAGNVWIYSIYNKVNTSDAASPQFCNYTLYYYAFWVTTLVYIIIGLSCFLGCCTCCAISCLGKSNK